MRFFTPLYFLFPAISMAEICYLPIDVMFLQDTTGSFEDDLPNVVRQIPNMVASILEQNPGSAFGVAEFKDKPYYPLGEPTDFCYKLNGPLTTDVDTFQYDYSLLYASGGGDLPESQFQALIDLSYDATVGWRRIVRDSRSSTDTGAHLIIMSTDAAPHLPGDMAKYADYPGGNVPQGLPANPGVSSADTISATCNDYDYPTPDAMKAALESQNAYLAILTPEDNAIISSWKWVNEDLLGQPSEFYQFIQSDSSDLISGVLRAIEAVTEFACATTTTLAPTGEATTITPTTPTTTTTTTTTTPTTTTTTTTPTTTTTTTTPTTPTTTTTTTTTPTTTTTTTTTTPTTTTTTTTTPTTTTTAPSSTTTTPTTTTTTTTSTTPPATTTTTAPTTTRSTTIRTTTAPITTPTTATSTEATITPVGSPQEASSEAAPCAPEPCPPCPSEPCPPCVPQVCDSPCPPHPKPCCRPALKIDLAGRPKQLLVDYIA